MPDTGTTEATPPASTAGEPPEDTGVADTPITDAEDTDEDQGDDGVADTFPRSYIEELRRENARYRERARNADAHAKRLHTELVRATASWPTRPTSSSARNISTIPTPSQRRSTSCWLVSLTWRHAGRPVKSAKALHWRVAP